MSIPAPKPGYWNRPPRGAHRREATPLTSSTWRKVRRTLTAGLFVSATVAGVVVGLNGAAVSPVAPVPATATTATTGQPGGIDLAGDAGTAAGLHRGPDLGRGAGFDDGPRR